jgi:soluble lytic murein transglycosylase-like protein
MSGLLPVYTVVGGLVMAVSVPIASLFSPVETTAPPVAAVQAPRIVVVSSTDAPTTTTTVVYVPTATPQATATPRPRPTATPPSATTSKTRPMPYVASKLGAHVPAKIKQYEPIIQKHAREYNVDPNFVAAVIMTESSGDPSAVSPKNAVGLMQVLDGPTDPDANIEEGTAIIGKWLKYYGSVELAIAAYNAGPGNVAKHGGIPPFPETHKHISRTLANYASYAAA